MKYLCVLFLQNLFVEKTIAQIKDAITAKPKARNSHKSDETSRQGRNLNVKNKSKVTKKQVVTPVKKVNPTNRLRTGVSTKVAFASVKTPAKSLVKKSSVVKVTSPPKRKTGKQIVTTGRAAVASETSVSPKSAHMEVLTFTQKRDRLRQELVKETEDNCLAKILCGGGAAKPQQKEKNTFVSDTAYLIKEFFNIFE